MARHFLVSVALSTLEINLSWCVLEVTTDSSFPRRMQAASDSVFGQYLGADCLGKSDIMTAKNQGEDEAKIRARDKIMHINQG